MRFDPAAHYRDRMQTAARAKHGAALTHGRRRARRLEGFVLVVFCFACVVAFLALALALALLILVVIA